jgi:hypothetical protein
MELVTLLVQENLKFRNKNFLYLRCYWFKKFKNHFMYQGKKQKIEKKFK